MTAYNILSGQKAEGGVEAVPCCAVTFEGLCQQCFLDTDPIFPRSYNLPEQWQQLGTKHSRAGLGVGRVHFTLKP